LVDVKVAMKGCSSVAGSEVFEVAYLVCKTASPVVDDWVEKKEQRKVV